MTILAHNLYRLLALELGRYSHFSDIRIYEQFIMNSGEFAISNNQVKVALKKKKIFLFCFQLWNNFHQSNTLGSEIEPLPFLDCLSRDYGLTFTVKIYVE